MSYWQWEPLAAGKTLFSLTQKTKASLSMIGFSLLKDLA
jgi:hypothetical protein